MYMEIANVCGPAAIAPCRDKSTSSAKSDALLALERLESALEQESAPLSADFLAEIRSNLAAMTLDQPSGSGLPFAIPKEYRGFPYLTGRATIALEIDPGSLPNSSRNDSSSASGSEEGSLEPILIEVDGYNAPLTAGRVVMLASQVGSRESRLSYRYTCLHTECSVWSHADDSHARRACTTAACSKSLA